MCLETQLPPKPTSLTDGVASLQLATSGAAALGVGRVVFLHSQDGRCLGNPWCSLVEGRGWRQSRGETRAGNIHRLGLLLQSAGGQAKAQLVIAVVVRWKNEYRVHPRFTTLGGAEWSRGG